MGGGGVGEREGSTGAIFPPRLPFRNLINVKLG